MKISDLDPANAIFANINQIDIEVLRAQRMQELRDMAEWRQRRMATIKEWSAAGGDGKKVFGIDTAADTARLQGQMDLLAESVMFAAPKLMVSAPYSKGVMMPLWKRMLARIFNY